MAETTSERADGRHVTTAAFVQHLMRQEPQLAYRVGLTADERRVWVQQVREKLRELLAFPDVPDQPAPRMIDEQARDGYRLQTWELYPEPYSVVPFNVLVPDSATPEQPAPAVLCFPGSQQPKEALCGEPWSCEWENRFGEHNFIALQYVKAGFVAVAFDNPGTCGVFDPERPSWRRQSEHLLWLGRSYEGLTVFQKIAALPWLRSQPHVDAARISTCGHSLGAKPALLLAVLDPDISAVTWNDNAADWRRQPICCRMDPVAPWHYVPHFIRWFDYMDLMCALAPTPLLITEGGYLPDHEKIQQAYDEAGASDNVRFSFMRNFADPANRCQEPMPEGLDAEAYARYCNYDGDHFFKDEVAVPWLTEVSSS